MLKHVTVSVIHARNCENGPKGDKAKKCKCVKYLYLSGTRERRSSGTRSWEGAQTVANELADSFNRAQRGEDAKPTVQPIEQRANEYIKILKSMSKSEAVPNGKSKDIWEKAELWIVKRMVPVLKAQDIIYLNQIEAEHLENWRADWLDDYEVVSLFTKQKMTGVLSSFFLYCIRKKWMKWNPCSAMERIKPGPTKPKWFTLDEMDVLLEASIAVYAKKAGWSSQRIARVQSRMHALINLARWSGARIGDCAVMRKDSLIKRPDGVWVLHFFAIKPQRWCTVPIPEFVAHELLMVLPEVNTHKDYFFWTAKGTAETAAKDWHEKLSEIFEYAGLEQEGKPKHCHPHMFRHTFAVLSLEAGVPLEHVSKAMGHSSVKITERAYAHWSKGREDILRDSFNAAWGRVAAATPASSVAIQ